MELFEILFIALLILFPIIEQVLKKGKKGRGPEPRPKEPRPERVETGPEPEPARASDMVPEDLWAVLTGERPGEGVGVEEERPAPVEGAPAEAPEPWEEPWTPRPEPRGRLEDEAPAPVSLEEYGPEAYSLETFDREPVERPVPTAAARHRRFHETIERPRSPRPERRS